MQYIVVYIIHECDYVYNVHKRIYDCRGSDDPYKCWQKSQDCQNEYSRQNIVCVFQIQNDGNITEVDKELW